MPAKKKSENLKKFNKIVKDIKSIKIQGARNVAREAVKAYFLLPSKSSKRKLLNSRPTEPMMEHVLNLAESGVPLKKILEHFEESRKKIKETSLNLVKNE